MAELELEEGLRARLLADGVVSGLVGTRIYPGSAEPGATLPFLVFARISGPREQGFDGPLGLAEPRVQFDSYAETWRGARALARALRQSLDGFRGTVSAGSPIASVTVTASRIENERDLYEPATRLRRVSTDFIFSHVET